MSKTLQFRRGTTSELSTIAGAVGELFVDTTKDTVVVMDGSTAGGFPLATEAALSSINSTLQSLAIVATSGSYNDLSDKPTIPSLSGYATETYVNTQVSNLVDAAPTTLNTLNELAAALGDDANFSTSIANQIGLKANAADLATVATSGSYNDLSNKPTIPTTTSQLSNDSGFVTSNDISGKQDALISGMNIKTINGETILGSGNITISASNADTLNGYDSSYFLNYNNLINKPTFKTINGQTITGSGNIAISGGTSGGSLDFGTFTSPAGFTLDMGIF